MYLFFIIVIIIIIIIIIIAMPIDRHLCNQHLSSSRAPFCGWW